MIIPVIDIAGFESGSAAERLGIARQWDEAFSTTGFATVCGHGLKEEMFRRLHAEASDFFALPQDEKQSLRNAAFQGMGFQAVGAGAAGRVRGINGPPDLVETLSYPMPLAAEGPVRTGQLRLPPNPPGFAGTLLEFVEQGCRLARTMMRISAIALRLPETYFDALYEDMYHNVRLLRYPHQERPPLPGQVRAGEHTDYTGFTILRQDDAPGGLEVQAADEQWIPVKPVAGGLVINAGDLIQRWTNDRWRSNVHRVVNPPRDQRGSTERISIVLFTGPAPDSLIECLPTCSEPGDPPHYPPIIAQDHLREKVRQSYS